MQMRAWVGHYLGNPNEWFLIFGETVDEALDHVDNEWGEPDRRSIMPIRHPMGFNFRAELEDDGSDHPYAVTRPHPDEMTLGEGGGHWALQEWITLRLKEPLGEPEVREVSKMAEQLGIEDAETLRRYLPDEMLAPEHRPVWGWKRKNLPEHWIDPHDLDIEVREKLAVGGWDPTDKLAPLDITAHLTHDGVREPIARIRGYHAKFSYTREEDELADAIGAAFDHVHPSLRALDETIRKHFAGIPMEDYIDSFVLLTEFEVDEKHRGRGIGSLALDRIIEHYSRAGSYPSHIFAPRVKDASKPLSAERSEDDEALLRFFARLGFDPIPDSPFVVLATAYNRPRPGMSDEYESDDEEPDDE